MYCNLHSYTWWRLEWRMKSITVQNMNSVISKILINQQFLFSNLDKQQMNTSSSAGRRKYFLNGNSGSLKNIIAATFWPENKYDTYATAFIQLVVSHSHEQTMHAIVQLKKVFCDRHIAALDNSTPSAYYKPHKPRVEGPKLQLYTSASLWR